MTTAAEKWFTCPVASGDGAVDIYLDSTGRWFIEFDDGPNQEDWETALLMVPIASRETPKAIAEDRFGEILRPLVDALATAPVGSAIQVTALDELGELLGPLRDWMVAVDRIDRLGSSFDLDDKPVDFDSRIFSFENDRFIFALHARNGWGEMKPDPEDPTTEFQFISCSLSDAIDFTDNTAATMDSLLVAHDELLGLAIAASVATINKVRAGVSVAAAEFDRLELLADLAGDLSAERLALS